MNETVIQKETIMKRMDTLTLLALACLTAIPSIAQARYRDGMNLYEYVRSEPVGRVDPSGLVSKPNFVKVDTTEWNKRSKVAGKSLGDRVGYHNASYDAYGTPYGMVVRKKALGAHLGIKTPPKLGVGDGLENITLPSKYEVNILEDNVTSLLGLKLGLDWEPLWNERKVFFSPTHNLESQMMSSLAESGKIRDAGGNPFHWTGGKWANKWKWERVKKLLKRNQYYFRVKDDKYWDYPAADSAKGCPKCLFGLPLIRVISDVKQSTINLENQEVKKFGSMANGVKGKWSNTQFNPMGGGSTYYKGTDHEMHGYASWNYLVRARRGYFERQRTLGTSFYDATLNYYNCQYALGYAVVRIRYIVSGTWERYDRLERQSMPAIEIQRTRAWKAGK